MGDYGDAMMRDQNAAVQARTKAQNRTNVMQLKLMGQSHPTGLTTNLLKMFEPRPPLEYKPPPEKRKCLPYIGIGQFVNKFAEPGDLEYAPLAQDGETPAQRRARVHQIRLEKGAKKATDEFEKYDPVKDPNISGDPYKTLFVARLNYETTESRIKREFEAYGSIKRVRLVTDKETNKPRGYAFVEFVHTRDMKAAYKQADGKKIDDRRVLVDVERGRTVPNWRPRRLGGGLGTTRIGSEEVSRSPGREQGKSGAIARSEEPSVRDEQDREKERSRERGREKSRERGREKSRERGRDKEREREKSRDCDHRDDRHHRDRGRNRDKDRERDHGRDRTHDRERGRDRARDHDRDRERERDIDKDREFEYDHNESKNERGGGGEREDRPEQDHGRYEYYEPPRGKYDDPDVQAGFDRYDRMD